MFTKPSVSQIEQAYTGNYQPLAAKVEQDKKQHGGIPHDLRQLLALNDIMQNRESAGIQQALNAPVNMPTVAQSMQQMAQQAIQARMMQQYQEQQRKDGKPMTVPPGVPQPDMQPRGIDSIPTDVGSGYASGGIIGNTHHFFEGDMVVDPMLGTTVGQSKSSDSDETILEKLGVLNPANRRALEKAERDLAKQKAGVSTKEETSGGRGKDPRSNQVKIDFADQLKQAATINKPAASSGSPKPATVRDNAPMPAGERPAAGLDAYLATPQKVLTTAMNVDPNQELKDRMALYKQLVGEQPTTGLDRMIAELDRRKAKLEGEAPKTGFAGLMDYLGYIAESGGKTWQDAGFGGSVLRNKANKAREEQINALIEKGIELAQKKEDVGYGFKKESYGLGLKAMEEAIKRKYDSAIALETNNLKREELKQQKEAELARLNQMRINPALQIAAAFQAAKTPEQREAIEKGVASVYGNRPTGPTSGMLNQYYDRLKDIDKSFEGDIRRFQGPKEQQALEADKNAKYQDVYREFAQYKIGPMAQGGGSGAGTATAVPLPPDARTNPSKLVVGTTYQTANGPAKWNGTKFEQ